MEFLGRRLVQMVLLLSAFLININIPNASATPASTSTHFYTSYENGIECTAASLAQPKNLAELQTIVSQAKSDNLHVKAVGSLHSVTDIICTDGIVVDMAQFKQFSFNSVTHQATAGAGLELQDFLEKLHENGRGLTASPAYGGITLGGAVAVGAIGTNLKGPATLSDQLVSIKFVDGTGNSREIDETSEDFKAVRVHLGLLGIVYELVFRTVEQYKLEIENFPNSDEILWTDEGIKIIELAESSDFFQFFWFPTNKEVVMSVGKHVPVNTSGNCETHLIPEVPVSTRRGVSMSFELMQGTADQKGYFFAQSYLKLGYYQDIFGRTPYFTKEDGCTSCLPKAIGYSHRMMANRCKACAWDQGPDSLLAEDGAVVIDVAQLPSAIKTLREIMDSILVGFPLSGLLFRFIKESNSYLSVNSDRRSVEIGWVSVPRFNRTEPKLGIAAFQVFGQALIKNHGGRPHWGKSGLIYTTGSIIRDAYPHLGKFIEVMNRTDPDELFMNDFGKRIKYGSDEMTLSKAAKTRCALNEACLCKRDSDCGDGTRLANVCTESMGFKVCRNFANEVNDKFSRQFINTIYALGLDKVADFVIGQLDKYDGFINFNCNITNKEN